MAEEVDLLTIRERLFGSLLNGGCNAVRADVMPQNEDGTIETLPLGEARAFLDALPPERRALCEEVESSGD